MFFAFLGGAPHIMIDVLKRTPVEYGLWFVTISVGYMIGNFLSGRYTQTVGIDRMILAGNLVTLCGGLLCLAAAITGFLSPATLFLPMSLAAFGNGLTIPNGTAGAISVDPRMTGAAAGWSGFTQMACGAAASQLVGSLQTIGPSPYSGSWPRRACWRWLITRGAPMRRQLERIKQMDSDELKSLQAPLKARYRETPKEAIITLKAEGEIGEGVTCSVATARAMVEAGLHPATGGTGFHACSGDMLLQALVACAGVTLNAVATALEIPLAGAKVRAEGDLDFRGTLGVDREAPVGFQTIRLFFDLEGDVSTEQRATLLKLTERYCVVYQTLRNSPPIAVEMTS